MFEADISQATVLALFLLPDNLRRLTPKFQSQLKPGTRLVMNGFPIPEWAPDVTEQATGDCNSWCTSHLYYAPAKVGGSWRLGQATLRFEQNFQMLSGTLDKTPISDARLKGEEISFTVGDTQYVGRVNGNAMSGETKGPRPGQWKATRLGYDHRHPRPLHHRAAGAARVPRQAARGPRRLRRASPPPPTSASATRQLVKSVQPQLKFQNERGSDLTHLLAARGAAWRTTSARRRSSLEWSRMCNDLIHRICTLLPDNFVAGRPAAAISGRVAEELHPRARAHRERARLRRREPQPRSLGRLLDRSAAHRPVLVPDLREAVRARRAGDDPRHLVVQPELPPHRRALHQRRHHRLHAADPGQPVQGFPDAEVRDPPWRRRGAVPLGPLPGPRAGHEAAAALRSMC